MSIAARLAREVAEDHLSADASQAAAASHLDRLLLELRAAPPSLAQRLKRRIGLSASAAPAARGVYLYGGVGRGKTLLMDLFFQELAGIRAERTHFYHFMRAVHAELRAAKQRTDPLQWVAERLASRMRVICLDEFFVSDIADAMILSNLFE